MDIRFYEIEEKYVDYLLPYEPRLFHNSKPGQLNRRKYIGIVLQVNNMSYFVPLSSFKPKHRTMRETLDFIKVKDYAVLNLNNMFPTPPGQYSYVDIKTVPDPKYRSLLMAEYRYIKTIERKIIRNAATLYQHKLEKGDSTPLARRCNDFRKLETACAKYGQL